MKTIVLSLGGSIIVPENIDIPFVRSFKKVIDKFVEKGYKFAIICGGGRIAREYQSAAKEIIKPDNEALDWLGIKATIMNAVLLKIIFTGNAERIVLNPNSKLVFEKNMIIASGWKPGWSTDYDAVLLAKNLDVSEIINMSNIDYIYDKDPKKFPDGKKIKNMSWAYYRKICGNKWKAGLNLPFDPIASKAAENLCLKVVFIGKNLRNFENCLLNKEFVGSIIE